MVSSKADKKKKDGKANAEIRKRARKMLSQQAWIEGTTLLVGSAAMIGSSYCNQAVPRLLGRLMDQSKPSTTSLSSSPPSSLVESIFIISLTGGTCSLIRTMMLNRAEGGIASRLKIQIFSKLITGKSFEWFQTQSDHSLVSGASQEAVVGAKTFHSNMNGNTTAATGSKDAKEEQTAIETPSAGLSPTAIGYVLKEDVGMVAKTVTGTLASLIRSSSSCAFGTYHMLMLNPSLVVLSLGLAPVVGTIVLVTRKYVKKVMALEEEAAIKAATFVEERLEHLALVKACGRESDETQTYTAIQDVVVGLGKKSSLANGISMGTMFSLSSMALCGILYSGGRSVKDGKMRHGDLVSFGTYSFLLALGTAGVVKAIGDYSRGLDSAVRLCRLMEDDEVDVDTNQPDDVDDGINKTSEAAAKNKTVVATDVESMSLSNVGFHYQNNAQKTVLRNVSLEAKRGEVVALVGKNGSGKSTMAYILAGLYQPTTGSVELKVKGESISLADCMEDAKSSSNIVKVVQQQPALFNISIRDNITYGNPTATDAEISDALKCADCDNFIANIEGGMDFVVGRNGCRLSGGQRQRIELARAFLANPAVLVMDEPSSALDLEGASTVVDAIGTCRTRKTALVVITHNTRTLELADSVAVLEDGTIAETGKPSKLLKDPKSKLSLLMTQR